MNNFILVVTYSEPKQRTKLNCSFIPLVTMVTTPLVGLVHVMPHVLPHSHLMKTSGDIASTSLYLLLIPINTNNNYLY